MLKVSLHQAGLVTLDEGGVFVGDVFLLSSNPTDVFGRPAAGDYPVCLTVAESADDARVAFAELRYSPRSVAHWELLAGGIGIDSGNAAFAGHDAVRAIDALGRDVTSWTDALLAEMARNEQTTWTWVDLTPPGAAGNIIGFSTGFGDGGYPIYAGHSADGSTVSLMIDFDVLPWNWAQRPGKVP